MCTSPLQVSAAEFADGARCDEALPPREITFELYELSDGATADDDKADGKKGWDALGAGATKVRPLERVVLVVGGGWTWVGVGRWRFHRRGCP